MQNISNDIFDQLQLFYNEITNYRVECFQQGKTLIFLNIDETPIHLNTHKSKTFDLKGKKKISVKGFENNKQRVTAVIMIDFIGNIFPLLIISKGMSKQQKQNEYSKYCILMENKNAWITENLYLMYLKATIGNLVKTDNIQFALIHDKCSSHITDQIKEYLNKIGIKESQIPAGTTSICQVLDVCINKPLKDKNKNSLMKTLLFQTQIINKQLLCYQNLQIIQKNIIIQRFKYCGFSHNINNIEEINQLIKDKVQFFNEFNKQIQNETLEPHDLEIVQKYNPDLILQTYEPSLLTEEFLKQADNNVKDNLVFQQSKNDEELEKQQHNLESQKNLGNHGDGDTVIDEVDYDKRSDEDKDDEDHDVWSDEIAIQLDQYGNNEMSQQEKYEEKDEFKINFNNKSDKLLQKRQISSIIKQKDDQLQKYQQNNQKERIENKKIMIDEDFNYYQKVNKDDEEEDSKNEDEFENILNDNKKGIFKNSLIFYVNQYYNERENNQQHKLI